MSMHATPVELMTWDFVSCPRMAKWHGRAMSGSETSVDLHYRTVTCCTLAILYLGNLSGQCTSNFEIDIVAVLQGHGISRWASCDYNSYIDIEGALDEKSGGART